MLRGTQTVASHKGYLVGADWYETEKEVHATVANRLLSRQLPSSDVGPSWSAALRTLRRGEAW